MIQWGDPRFLPVLWALVPLGVLLVLLVWLRERRWRRLLETAAADQLSPERRRSLSRVKAALWLAAFVLSLASLARPQWGIRWQAQPRRGLDIVVVLDTSRSMLATDVRPSRMERAKWGLNDLLQRLGGDRVGLVAFAGSSFLTCPLTTDYAAFSMVLDDVRPGTIPRGGTAIAQALEAALAAFDKGGAADRVVILVTDGEDHAGGIERATAALAQQKVRVFAVGIGSGAGELIPSAQDVGGFLRDRSGAVVRTALREETLRKIAAATGGTALIAAGGDFGWDRVLDTGFGALRREEREARLVKAYAERFPWFLGGALALLAVETLLGERRRGKGASA